jgi:hypothetical protein
MTSYIEAAFPNAIKLSKHIVLQILFAIASALVCSTTAKFLSLAKALQVHCYQALFASAQEKSLPQRIAPEIGGYAILKCWSNELAENSTVAFLVKDKTEAYAVAKKQFAYSSLKEAIKAENGNGSPIWAEVQPITKALFERLEKNGMIQHAYTMDSRWLYVWACKIGGEYVPCTPEEDPYEQKMAAENAKKAKTSGAAQKAAGYIAERQAQRLMKLEL